ncbi:DUF4265 domain-containing protein [Nannocystis pusilla]|uniref:DUF4265 domain-containing protein n=1 Tax=Nannocystis pusilla TaxID=889268 RepID=A0ABS7U361_9BACT|nr:DUF4265 domain-containing protein [Nannocystis pusilla]MBZ5714890.1 DUF4265 domain-containing protein [Nannocystis pusilla]
MVKVLFYPDDQSPESLWAEDLGDGQYKLRNSPWFMYGVSFEDVVRARPAADGMLEFVEVVQPSGSSTFRLMLREDTDPAMFERYWKPLQALGCTWEQAKKRLYAVDAPRGADLERVADLLEKGGADGVWDWETGCWRADHDAAQANARQARRFIEDSSRDLDSSPERFLTVRHAAGPTTAGQCPVIFRLVPDEDGYPDFQRESLWAIPRADGTYQIANIPFYSYDAARGDIVSVKEGDGELFFDALLHESGNSVIRIIVKSAENVDNVRRMLEELGCDTEALGRLVAVNIPAHVDYGPLRDRLVAGEQQERWGFEEAVLCHGGGR